MGVKISQLPALPTTAVASDDYLPILDTSDSILKRTTANHATNTAAFGLGSTANYGHVKLSDVYATSVGDASTGIGASQAAVKSVYDSIPGLASTATAGTVKPDGTTITVDASGKISSVQVAVDTAMSSTSTNPVQNKVITSALENTISTTNMFKLDDQTLSFTNRVATIADMRITADTQALVYYNDATLQNAIDAQIVANTQTGVITFSAANDPAGPITCDITFIKIVND